MERTGRMPNMNHAGTYSAVTQYLKAIEAAGTDETEAVAAKLHEMPVEDFFAQNGKVGPNGRMIHDMYLMEVKAPADSEGDWDYYNVLATIPGDEAYIVPTESGCPLVTRSTSSCPMPCVGSSSSISSGSSARVVAISRARLRP